MKKTIAFLVLLAFIASVSSFAVFAKEGNQPEDTGIPPFPGNDVEDNSVDVEVSGQDILVGNDSDEHGCKGSAGYSWCESLGECIRPWETECEETQNPVAIANQQKSQEMRQNMEKMQVKTQEKLEEKDGKTFMNGREVKVMPETASARALEVLGAKCAERNCTIELKEVGKSNETKLVYEIKTQKEAKILGFIKTKMQVEAQIDAETGEVIQTKRPWWSFLAKEENEAETEE